MQNTRSLHSVVPFCFAQGRGSGRDDRVGVRSGAQQVPCFAIFFVKPGVFSCLAGGVNVNRFASEKYFHREYIPGVIRGYIDDYEIYVGHLVGYRTSAVALTDVYVKAVLMPGAIGEDGLHLNSQHAAAAVEQEIVGESGSIGTGRV